MNGNFIFVTYNSETGEIDESSGIYTFADIESVEAHFQQMKLESHNFAEITPEELDLVRKFDLENNIRVHKIDVEKIEGRIEERDTINMPIEVEGIGGKEIIGYETKPVGIVIERELSPEKGKIGKE